MSRDQAARSRRQAGFTLLELAITSTMLAIAAGMGMPAMLNYMQKAKLEGAAKQAVMMLNATRLEAITRGAPAVLAIDESTGELVAFVDVEGPVNGSLPDGIFNPVSGDVYKYTDYELSRFRMPAGLTFATPTGDVGVDSVDGFANPAPIPAGRAYFEIDGSVADDGAFRFADARGNFLEARIAAASTGRVELRKWDGLRWREQGEGEAGAWDWQ